MKKVTLLITVIAIIIVIIILSQRRIITKDLKTISINNHQLQVEIADTDETRSKGLSGREKLAVNEGMLFIFPAKGYYNFWMKEMKFPLDFVWIDKNRVVDLTENVLPAKAASELNTFSAKYPFDKVLEVNAGTISTLNITIGSQIH